MHSAKISFLNIAPGEIDALVEATFEDPTEDIVEYTRYKRQRMGYVWNK